jgi:hypothetical protein
MQSAQDHSRRAVCSGNGLIESAEVLKEVMSRSPAAAVARRVPFGLESLSTWPRIY